MTTDDMNTDRRDDVQDHTEAKGLKHTYVLIIGWSLFPLCSDWRRCLIISQQLCSYWQQCTSEMWRHQVKGYWWCSCSGSRLRRRGGPCRWCCCGREAACRVKAASESGCREPRPQRSSPPPPGAWRTTSSSALTHTHTHSLPTCSALYMHELFQDRQHSPGSWPQRTSRRSWLNPAAARCGSVCGVWAQSHL